MTTAKPGVKTRSMTTREQTTNNNENDDKHKEGKTEGTEKNEGELKEEEKKEKNVREREGEEPNGGEQDDDDDDKGRHSDGEEEGSNEIDSEEESDEDDSDDESRGTEVTTYKEKSDEKTMTEEERIARGLHDDGEEDIRETTQKMMEATAPYLSDWISIDNYVSYIAFIPVEQRLPTKYWYALPDEMRKTCRGFRSYELRGNETVMQETIDAVKQRYAIRDRREFVWKAIKGLGKDMKLGNHGNKDAQLDSIMKVGIRMTMTLIDDIKKEYYTKYIYKEIESLWVTYQQLFGCTGEENENKTIIYDIQEDKNTVDDHWYKVKNMAASGYTEEDFKNIKGNNPWKDLQTVEDSLGETELNCNTNDWQTFAVIQIHAPEETPEQQARVETFVKLAKTPPQIVPGWDESTKTIENNQFSMAWAAINRIWGRTWKQGVRWDADTIATASVASKRGKLRRRKSKRSQPPIKSLMFVQRDNNMATTHVLDRRWNRQHTTYLKIRLLPIAGLTNFDTALEQRVNDFNSAIMTMCEVDRRACLTPWKSIEELDPIDHNSTMQNTRDFVKPYAENFYVARGKGGSYIRVRMRHDTAMDEILSHSEIKTLKKERGVQIYEDKIQAQDVQMVGWWAGSINSRYGINDLEWAIKNQPIAKQHQIDNLEIRIGVINNRGKYNKIPEDEERVFAMHMYCEKSKAAVLRDLLLELYPAQPNQFYLMGRQMRFVPNIHMSAAAKPPGAFQKAQDLKEKQARFLKNVRVVTSDEIIKLHRPLNKSNQTTLVEMLTAWKSPLYPEENLFIAVEDLQGTTNFHYLEKNEEAAEATVSFLGMILAKQFGPDVWGWFRDTTRTARKEYAYIQAENVLIPTQTQKNEAEWNFGLDDARPTTKTTGPTRIDIGKIDLEQKERGRPLEDDSVATMGMRAEDSDIDTDNESDADSRLTEDDDNSTMSDSLATAHRRARKQATTGGKTGTAQSEDEENTQNGGNAGNNPHNNAGHGNREDVKETQNHQEDDAESTDSSEDDSTESVSLASKRKNTEKRRRDTNVVTPQKNTRKDKNDSPEMKKSKPTNSPSQNESNSTNGDKKKQE